MVLGAGLGTRLRPFTDRFPKPLMPVHGVPCIEYSLLALKRAGVKQAVINVHAHADQMRAYLNSNPVTGIHLQESDESQVLLGSAGGFKKALPLIPGEAFFSMNADVIHLVDLDELRQKHLELKSKYGVLMTLVLASGSILTEQSGEYREIFVDESTGLVKGFGEKKSRVPFYTGSAVFEKDAFLGLSEGVPADFVSEVLEPAIRAGRVGYIYSDALWIDIGSPELWHQAQGKVKVALHAHALPEAYAESLLHADPTLQGRFELGKNRIRLDDIEYEIKDIRSP